MGGTKQDKAPVSHAAASPCCHKENAWRDHRCRVHPAVAVEVIARQLDEPCNSLAIPPENEKNENQDLWVSAFRNANCNATYLFWKSPCRDLTFIWHFEMLIKCNANISIPGLCKMQM